MERTPTPEQDFELARRALEKGALRHAAEHLAGALAVDPTRPQFLALADELVARGPEDAAQRVGLNEQGTNWFGAVALRAYLLARTGGGTDAVSLLLQASSAGAQAKYLAWLPGWLEQPGFVEALDPERVAGALEGFFESVPQALQESMLEPVLAALERIRQAHGTEPYLMLVHARALRRAGRVEEGLLVAREHHARAPQFLSAVAVAGGYRELGRVDEAIAAFREASRFQPGEVSIPLDIGDMLLDAGRLEEAASAYEEVLRRDPGHPWATASLLYVKHRLSPQAGFGEKLRKLVHSPTGEKRAAELVWRLDQQAASTRRGRPYVSFLPEPGEATVSAVKRVLGSTGAEVPKEGSLDVTLGCLEAPSALLGSRRQLLDRGSKLVLKVQVEYVPEPDPRLPLTPEGLSLWRYQGTTASPALPKPAPRIAGEVALLAGSPFRIDSWREQAARVGPGLSPKDARSLLAVMVHPPPTPAGMTGWGWVFSVQLASALLLAYLGETVSGLRKLFGKTESGAGLLKRLVNGQGDWAAGAAALALAEWAREGGDVSLRIETLKFIRARLETRPNAGYWPLERPFVCAALRLAEDMPDIRAELERRLALLET